MSGLNSHCIMKRRLLSASEVFLLLKQKNAGNMAGARSSGNTGTVTTTQESDTVSTMTAFTIEEGDQMTVAMYVDELDVLSMKEGLQAEITLDTVEDTTFEGTITSVDAQASSSGGVAQYPVNITFDKTEDMLSGMNASVKVILEEADNVLTIPLTAVTEEGNTSYVYTGYDESTGELSGKTEVTLGVSDGNTVEVTDGLNEGDTIYYQMACHCRLYGSQLYFPYVLVLRLVSIRRRKQLINVRLMHCGLLHDKMILDKRHKMIYVFCTLCYNR